MTAIKEYIPVRGVFACKVIGIGDKVLEEYEDRNLVVNLGRNNAAQLLGGGSTTKNITQIGFGTSGVNPSPTDVDLTDKFQKNIASVSYPQTGAVAFDFTLDFGEANGKDIAEFGLFNADGELFSRKTRTNVIEKTSDIQITGTWTIQF